MHCDADFCNCGRCKSGGSHTYLVKYVAPEPEPVIVLEKPPTQYDQLVLKIKNQWSVLNG